MKANLFIGMTALVLWACLPARSSAQTAARMVQDTADSTQYSIVITDPQFEQWYLLNFNEAKDYTNDFYRAKDRIGSSNWNDYYRTNKYPRVIDTYLNYQPEIDYGIDVNRKLFWYFKFLEVNYGIRLLR